MFLLQNRIYIASLQSLELLFKIQIALLLAL